MAGNPPDFQLQEVVNDDLPPESGIPNRQQWHGVINGDSEVTFMNVDLAMGVNLPDVHDVSCDFLSGSATTLKRFEEQAQVNPGACVRDTPFLEHIFRYLADTRLFLEEFRDVLNLLIDFGHHKVPLGDCPPGDVCSFGFVSPELLIGETPDLPDPIHVIPSTSTPTATPPPPPAIPHIVTDRSCYSPGDMVMAIFEDLVEVHGVWIGVFKRTDLPQDDFSQLPPLSLGLLRNWILTCGRSDTCDDGGWPSQGSVALPTHGLESDTEYWVVVSGQAGSTSGQAGALFSVGQC